MQRAQREAYDRQEATTETDKPGLQEPAYRPSLIWASSAGFFIWSALGLCAFNLFNSILAGIAVFIGGYAFGHWVTNSDPAFLRILAKSEKYKLRYDAAKQSIPRVEVV
ncbi:MAG TPA: hypothetical protein VFN53_03735 [Acidobacteriaceae bacterium]|nr:hypothetical protein [Acidobacteriaceae bacterium]